MIEHSHIHFVDKSTYWFQIPIYGLGVSSIHTLYSHR